MSFLLDWRSEMIYGQYCNIKKYVTVTELTFIPEYNSLSKASALKVNTALRKFAALSL